jgi:hypothetical protein
MVNLYFPYDYYNKQPLLPQTVLTGYRFTMETEVATKILQRPTMPTDDSFQIAADRRHGDSKPHKCQSAVFGFCYTHTLATDMTVEIVIPRLTKIIRSGITFVHRNVICHRFLSRT